MACCKSAFAIVVISFGASVQNAPAADLNATGTRPGYAKDSDISTAVPNQQAISALSWAPGLDDGYDPQGLTVIGDSVLVSGYKEKQPCRIFRMNQADGKVTGRFDLKTCHHGGGLAYAGREGGADILVVADTSRLFKVNLKAAFEAGAIEPGKGKGVLAYVDLAGGLVGSFADFDARSRSVFIGTYLTKSQAAGKAVGRTLVPLALLDSANGRTLDSRSCTGCKTPAATLAADAQGAAYDAAGVLWYTSSSSQFGCLTRTGPNPATFPMVAGIEDIGFDGEGRLWAVSESGSSKYWSDAKWKTRFPFVFRIDVAKLAAGPCS
jgi:hypothetical protein